MQVKGYRYLEEDNSDESDSEKSDIEAIDEDRQSEEETDGDVGSQGSHSPGPERNRVRSRRMRRDDSAYEQAGEREEYAQALWHNTELWLNTGHITYEWFSYVFTYEWMNEWIKEK